MPCGAKLGLGWTSKRHKEDWRVDCARASERLAQILREKMD